MAIAADNVREKYSGSIDVGEVLPRIVQGGGWSTEIQVINMSDENRSIPYTIQFFGGDGEVMNLFYTGPTGSRTAIEIAGIAASAGVDIYKVPNTGSLRAGYGVLDSSDFREVVVNVVLTQSVPGRPDFQATIPAIGEFNDHSRMVFRNERPFTTVVAITSGVSLDQVVTYKAFAQNGSLMCQATQALSEGAHRAFVLQDELSCTAGQSGVLEITVERFGAAPIGMIFHDFGPFTTQIPYELCCIR